MKQQTKSYEEHARSRYMCVTIGVVDVLQHAYFAGHDLGNAVPSIDADTAAIIVAETLEADRVLHLDPERMFSDTEDLLPMTDFKQAVLAELFFEVSNMARDTLDDREKAAEWLGLAMAALQACAESPIASPLLWYQDIFWELAQETRGSKFEPGNIQKAITWMKRALAHSLKFNDGINAPSILRDLAEMHIAAGELDTGLRMFTALFRHNPADIWVYNIIAISFDGYGLTDIGRETIKRGLTLLDAQGDEAQLRDQLENCLERMAKAEIHGRESEVSPAVLADFRAALALDFDAGQPRPVAELCRDLVPDLDTVPVKRPMTPADLPLPATPPQRRRGSERRTREAAHVHPLQPPANKPGRNDPCWCGSGKKYKHCHLRSDLGGA